jgi:hypothetical protein
MISRVKPKKKKILKGALIVHKRGSMRGMNYQASDAAEKQSRYQTKSSQVYVRIYHKAQRLRYQFKRHEISDKLSKKKYYASPPGAFFFSSIKETSHKNKDGKQQQQKKKKKKKKKKRYA